MNEFKFWTMESLSLASNVSTETIRRAIKEGDLTAKKAGRFKSSAYVIEWNSGIAWMRKRGIDTSEHTNTHL